MKSENAPKRRARHEGKLSERAQNPKSGRSLAKAWVDHQLKRRSTGLEVARQRETQIRALEHLDTAAEKLIWEAIGALREIIDIDRELMLEFHADNQRLRGLNPGTLRGLGRGTSLQKKNLQAFREASVRQDRIFKAFESYLRQNQSRSRLASSNQLAQRFSAELGMGVSTVRKYLDPIMRLWRKPA